MYCGVKVWIRQFTVNRPSLLGSCVIIFSNMRYQTGKSGGPLRKPYDLAELQAALDLPAEH